MYNNTFQWSGACEDCSQALGKALTTALVLGHFNKETRTTVTTDASAVALGAVLSQCQSGKNVAVELQAVLFLLLKND